MRDSGDDGRSHSDEWSGGGGSKPSDWVRWFFETEDGVVAFVREVLGSVLAVMLVGLLLFAISGLWPPMVAVESSSMHPNLQKGDLVFVMEEHRFAPRAAHGQTGIVTHRTGQQTGYTKFGRPGDVIVYRKNGQTVGTPIIHRAMFWVNESENWYEKADPSAIGSVENCQQLRNCPAPHAGFVTKGDNNGTNAQYDQVTGLSSPVRPAWVVGTAEVRIPLLGYVRLLFGQMGTQVDPLTPRGVVIEEVTASSSHGGVPLEVDVGQPGKVPHPERPSGAQERTARFVA